MRGETTYLELTEQLCEGSMSARLAEFSAYYSKPTVCPSDDSASMLSYQELPTSIQVWRGYGQEAKIR
jgi:hypothetical protein